MTTQAADPATLQRRIRLLERRLQRMERHREESDKLNMRQEVLLSKTIRDLEQAQTELQASRNSLEHRVQERTTELARANADLKRATVEAQQSTAKAERATAEALDANHSKSRFLAMMSHELRTPLTAIIGFSELMLDEEPDTPIEVVHDDIAKILGSAQHLLALINDILDLSKIEAGHLECVFADVSLLPLLDQIAQSVRPLVQRQHNQLIVDLQDAPEHLYTDAFRLRQCLYNLLSNAAKFTTRGSITLRVTSWERDRQPWMRMEVQDTGEGIAPDALERLFQPFAQADASVSSRHGGTGLGLAITRNLCALLGGEVHVHSVVDTGSTFTIELPRDGAQNRT